MQQHITLVDVICRIFDFGRCLCRIFDSEIQKNVFVSTVFHSVTKFTSLLSIFLFRSWTAAVNDFTALIAQEPYNSLAYLYRGRASANLVSVAVPCKQSAPFCDVVMSMSFIV